MKRSLLEIGLYWTLLVSVLLLGHIWNNLVILLNNGSFHACGRIFSLVHSGFSQEITSDSLADNGSSILLISGLKLTRIASFMFLICLLFFFEYSGKQTLFFLLLVSIQNAMRKLHISGLVVIDLCLMYALEIFCRWILF